MSVAAKKHRYSREWVWKSNTLVDTWVRVIAHAVMTIERSYIISDELVWPSVVMQSFMVTVLF